MSQANPEVTASLRAAGVTAGLTPERLIFVGSKLPAGTAINGVLQENIGNDGAEDGLFAPDSPLALAIQRARRRNPMTQIDAIGITDAGGAAQAVGNILVTGPATADGTLSVFVGSKKFNEYKIAITDTDTPATIHAAILAAINADTRVLVVASGATPNIVLTAKNGGTFGNTIGLKVEGSVAGVGIVLTAMTGGATDPTLTGVFDVVGKQRYQGVAWQFDQELDEVKDFLDARFNVTNNVLDGRAFVGMTDTFSNLLALAGPLNSNSLSIAGLKLIARDDHQGPGLLEVPFVAVAEFAGTRALRRTDDSVLGALVIARSSRDGFGGPWQNSKPYFNTPFPDLLNPDLGDSFEEEIEVPQLLAAGIWIIDSNRALTAVVAGQVVTTYKTDAAGNPDPTFTFLNYVDTCTAAREYIVNNTRAQYPQFRAAGGQLLPDVDSANVASVAAFVSEKNAELGDLALVNVGAGEIDGDAVDYDKSFRENLTVTLNPVSGRFFVSCRLYIVTQMRGVVYDMAVAFEV